MSITDNLNPENRYGMELYKFLVERNKHRQALEIRTTNPANYKRHLEQQGFNVLEIFVARWELWREKLDSEPMALVKDYELCDSCGRRMSIEEHKLKSGLCDKCDKILYKPVD